MVDSPECKYGLDSPNYPTYVGQWVKGMAVYPNGWTLTIKPGGCNALFPTGKVA